MKKFGERNIVQICSDPFVVYFSYIVLIHEYKIYLRKLEKKVCFDRGSVSNGILE